MIKLLCWLVLGVLSMVVTGSSVMMVVAAVRSAVMLSLKLVVISGTLTTLLLNSLLMSEYKLLSASTS